MAISSDRERSLAQLADELEIEEEPEERTVVSLDEDPEDISVEEIEGGGAVVSMGDPSPSYDEVPFDANLAEVLPEEELARIALDVIDYVRQDLESRKDWERTYKKGMENLGLTIEERTEPWPGACAATHPLLGEAVVKFQAQTIGEIFPARGPVKTTIVGLETIDKEKQAKRVEGYMNYVATNEMEEYRPETEKMLFSLPLAGSAFRKIYYDDLLGRPASMFVPAEDVIVNYNASDIYSADCVTHRLKKSHNDLLKLQLDGFYRDVEIPEPSPTRDSIIEDEKDRITGVRPSVDRDVRHVIYECHTNLLVSIDEDGTGIAYPYIVTVDRDSSMVLALRRNWKEEDTRKKKRQFFVHYDFIPGLGFYGFGMVHMIGGLSKAATSILRQLVDSGTLANVPAGFKTRGLRMKNEDTPLMPGEFRDVDVPGGALKDHLLPLPVKEPSKTLYELLVYVVEAGQRFASMADLKVADMNQDAPVGTTLAILERAMKVQSAVQARIHAGLKKEFRMLAEIIRDFTEPAYPYEVEAGSEIKKADFDDRVDVIPVSDPNAGTMAQRIMQYQAVLQLASQNPQIYDLPTLHRQIIEVLGVANADKIVPVQEEVPPTDPVSENGNIMNMSPVKAYQHQDHQAHLRVHKILLMDPQIAEMLQNSPTGPAIQSAVDAHVREHLALLYRAQIEDELGTELPPLGEPLPADVEKRLSTLVADAAEQLLGKKQAMAMAERNAALQQDPVIQQKEKELEIRMAEVQRKMLKDKNDAELAERKRQTEAVLKLIDMELQSRADAAEQEAEGIKLGIGIGETLDKLDVEREKAKNKPTPRS